MSVSYFTLITIFLQSETQVDTRFMSERLLSLSIGSIPKKRLRLRVTARGLLKTIVPEIRIYQGFLI